MTDYNTDPAISNLRNYLRIRSVHPNVNYDECIKYLKNQAKDIGLPVQVYEPLPNKPVVMMTWTGTDPTLPSILLNSHMDVVPVFEKSWRYPPFEARLEDGVVYGRGVQDMKSVGIQYIEAVRRLKNKGVQLKRKVLLSFVSDEEAGGTGGLEAFVQTEAFRFLHVGFALDEGMASPNDDFLVFNCERVVYHLDIISPGKSGHGSLLLADNCGEKLRYVIDKLFDLRQESKKKLADNPELTIGDVTTYNLTMVSGGVQQNVVPESLTATFDVRLAPEFKPEQFEHMMSEICAAAGSGVRVEYVHRDPYVEPTKVDDSNPYWLAFKAAADKLNITVHRRTFPGATDSRYIRALGIPALGFSPMSLTEPGMHEHNESLRADVFLRGIGIYEEIIPAIANV